MRLYNFFRSGTSHRLRIALKLKGLQTEYVPVDLRSEQHLTDAFKALNPQGLVPALEHDGKVLIQSPAIIEWLEERHPTPADVYLIPQVESARRFKVDLSPWPNIRAVDEACGQLEAFRLAAPAQQADAA